MSRARRNSVVVLALLGTAGLTGCVERRYTIRTNVPAVAYVNGEEVGPTPASRSFVYYGDREIILNAPGYQTLKVVQPIDAPWWDNMLTEFFTENLVPFTFRDERVYQYNLVPYSLPPVEGVVDRGANLRQQAQSPPPPKRRGILGFFGF